MNHVTQVLLRELNWDIHAYDAVLLCNIILEVAHDGYMCVQSSPGFTQCIVITRWGKRASQQYCQSKLLTVKRSWSPQCRKSRMIWQLAGNSLDTPDVWFFLLNFKTFWCTGFWSSGTNRNSEVRTFPFCFSILATIQSPEYCTVYHLYRFDTDSLIKWANSLKALIAK